MEQEKQIVVDFYESGLVTVEAVGYEGSECLDATKFLEELGTMENRALKPEFNKNKWAVLKSPEFICG